MTETLTQTLPPSLPVPDWIATPAPIEIQVVYGAVRGVDGSTLSMVAMGPDDVLVSGTLAYRGHEYHVSYAHTDFAGNPKGYFYRNTTTENGGWRNEQVYDVIPETNAPGRRVFFRPEAPKTYVEPLLEAVADAVRNYVANHSDHVRAGQEAVRVQNLIRAARTYNTLAEGAAKALAEYEAI